MPLNSALYFPHTWINSENLLKSAVLLWDQIEVITPFPGFPLGSSVPDGREALEMVGIARPLSDEEKVTAHERIRNLVASPLPSWFEFELANPDMRYRVYADKLLPDTWCQLQASGLATKYEKGHFEDFVLSRWLGLTLMAVLAETCAGTTRRLLTDEADSYSALGRYVTNCADGVYGAASADHERLVTLPLKSFDLSRVSLGQLVKLRAREDAFLRELRHNYLRCVDEAVVELSGARTAEDRSEIDRLFLQGVEDGLVELHKALGGVGRQVLLSNEFLVAALIAAGAIVEPWTSAVVGIGALARGLDKYQSARRDVMREHASAWLVQAPNAGK